MNARRGISSLMGPSSSRVTTTKFKALANSKLRPVNPDRRGLAAPRTDGQEQTIELRDEKRRAGTRTGLDPRDVAITGPVLLDDGEHALAAAHVDPAAAGVDGHVVGILAGPEGRDRGALRRVENRPGRGGGMSHEQWLARCIRRPREIAGDRAGPMRAQPAGG